MPLLYRIEFRDSSLWVKIEEQGSRRILYLDTLKNLAKPEDQPALSLLTKIHLRSPNASRNSETLSFQQIEVGRDQSLDVLQLLAKTGRLQMKNEFLKCAEKPAKLYWRGEKRGALSAVLDWSGREIPLEECSQVFPGWSLWNEWIISFSNQVPWKWVELFLKGPKFLEGIPLKRFLEEDPPILWKELPAEKPLEVFPQLILTDTTGCFANLWMDYPGVGRVAKEDLAPSVGGKARLKEAEAAWEKDLLEAGYQRKVVGHSRYYCAGDKVKETLLFLLEIGWKLFDPRGRAILRQTDCEWNLREEERGIAIRGNVHFQDRSVPLRAAMQTRGFLLEIDGQNVGLLDVKPVQGIWEEETLIVKKSSFGAFLPLLAEGRVEWEENVRRMAEGLREGASFETALPGDGFRGTLLPYQQKGVDWLSFLQKWGFSGLLADEMGLGKTVQVLAFFSRLRTNLPILIVAPSSLLYHWRSEIGKFLPEMSVRIHAGTERSTDFKGVVITSYAILRMDEELFSQAQFEVIVLDESNAIKTAATQTAKAAYRLKGKFKIALTGTPIENRVEELGSQFRFLLPDLDADFRAAGYEMLKRKIRPFFLKRRKQDVEIELPEKIEQISWVEMNEAQAEVYEAFRSNCREELLNQPVQRMEILEAILRLRQICCDPRLVGHEIEGTKLELLLQDLEEVEGKKVLIYSQFTSMLQLIGDALNRQGKKYLYLDGSVPSIERAERVRQFQEGEISLFLLSLKAGGVGLNLTAADYVFLFDPWWNNAVERQAIDRAHRIGRKNTVIAKRYLVPQSIEEKMLRLKEEKSQLAEQLLDGENINWTEEDLLHLLS